MAVKPGKDTVLKFSEHKRKREDDLEGEVDALFTLPVAEFTGARNALAAQLKKGGRADAAVRVKALAKPSISAWAVNQLYWNHREAFDQLIASGERFHKAQKSGKVAGMREALEARREALTDLSDLATSVLVDVGHSSSPDTIHRITTTLEGMSAYASRSDGPRPGRLTHDVDPPGFESFGSFVPGATKVETGGRKQTTGTPTRPTDSREASNARKDTPRQVASKDRARQLEETRKARIAAAKASLQDAKGSLTEARTRAQSLQAAQKKADAEVTTAEKHRHNAKEELRKAKAASEDAAKRARSVAVEVERAASAVEGAERTIDKASKELESMLRESSEK